jgi:acyl-coenzyme A thioesterase PaaI-like protein
MDYEALRGAMEVAVPYNSFLGLQVAEIAEGRGVVRLPDDERLRNHTGSQHASALFSLGEAAAAAAFVGTFGDAIAAVEPNVLSAQITHTALARGPIDAVGTLTEPVPDVLDRFGTGGTVAFTVEVQLINGADTTVAEMTVHWTADRRAEA